MAPQTAPRMASAFSTPLAARRTFLAPMMAPMPMLMACLGTSSRVAKKRALGVDHSTLVKKLRQYGLAEGE